MKDSSLTKQQRMTAQDIVDSLVTENMAQVARVVLRNGRAQSDPEANLRLWSYNKILRIAGAMSSAPQQSLEADLTSYKSQITHIIGEIHACMFAKFDQQISADIVLGIGIAFPKNKLVILEAVMDAELRDNCEGILTGLFEIADLGSIGDACIFYESELFEAIAVGSLLSALIETNSTDRCRGRLSTAIMQFIQPVFYSSGSADHYRPILISGLIKRLTDLMSHPEINPDRFKYFNKNSEPADKKLMSCIEVLCSELCSRFVLESGLKFKMEMVSGVSFDPKEYTHQHLRVMSFMKNINDLMTNRH